MGEMTSISFSAAFVLSKVLAQGCLVQVVQLLAARLVILLFLGDGHGNKLRDWGLLRLEDNILARHRFYSLLLPRKRRKLAQRTQRKVKDEFKIVDQMKHSHANSRNKAVGKVRFSALESLQGFADLPLKLVGRD